MFNFKAIFTDVDVQGFYNGFRIYHMAIWPMVFISNFLGILAVFLIFKKKRNSSKIISGILAFLWVWVGIFFFLIFMLLFFLIFYTISGICFILQGILFFFVGVYNDGFSFKIEKNRRSIIGMIMIIYALTIYPLIGFLLGFDFIEYPIFGVDPCPVCIFTFGILLYAEKRIPSTILIIPFLWSLTGFLAILLYGALSDVGEVIFGFIGLYLLLSGNEEA